MPEIEIRLVHDLVCSWCPIGYRNVRGALDRLHGQVSTHIRFLPFQLNPDMPEDGEEIDAHLARRMKRSPVDIARYKSQVVAVAEAAGVRMDYGRRKRYWNTFRAHCLLNASEALGRQTALVEALHRAYYAEGADIGDPEVLISIADSVDIDARFARRALASEANRAEVVSKESHVRRALAVRSIPTLLIDDRILVAGSNSVEFFVDLFRRIAAGQIKTVMRGVG